MKNQSRIFREDKAMPPEVAYANQAPSVRQLAGNVAEVSVLLAERFRKIVVVVIVLRLENLDEKHAHNHPLFPPLQNILSLILLIANTAKSVQVVKVEEEATRSHNGACTLIGGTVLRSSGYVRLFITF
jgi:hypothetical protein